MEVFSILFFCLFLFRVNSIFIILLGLRFSWEGLIDQKTIYSLINFIIPISTKSFKISEMRNT